MIFIFIDLLYFAAYVNVSMSGYVSRKLSCLHHTYLTMVDNLRVYSERKVPLQKATTGDKVAVAL